MLTHCVFMTWEIKLIYISHSSLKINLATEEEHTTLEEGGKEELIWGWNK